MHMGIGVIQRVLLCLFYTLAPYKLAPLTLPLPSYFPFHLIQTHSQMGEGKRERREVMKMQSEVLLFSFVLSFTLRRGLKERLSSKIK